MLTADGRQRVDPMAYERAGRAGAGDGPDARAIPINIARQIVIDLAAEM
jgi:hypothetical protein